MRVYEVRTDKGPAERYSGRDEYCRLLLTSLEDQIWMREHFKGQPISLVNWKPFNAIRMYSEPENLIAPLGDLAGIDANRDPMVLSKKALDVLMPMIGQTGQVLPIDFAECEYSFFNITNVVDALDEGMSEIERFPSSGRIAGLKRYAFKSEALKDQWLFKVPQQLGNVALATQSFVDLVGREGLTGFAFKLLWSDERS
jgi:hypothetical protein